MNASFVPLFLQAQQGGVSPLIWIILVVLVIVLILWWLGRREPADTTRSTTEDLSRQVRSSKGAEVYTVPDTASAYPTDTTADIVEDRASMIASEPVTDIAPDIIPDMTPPALDDLTVVEGIGPKIAAVLQARGITTLSQLASRDPSEIREILQVEGLRLADPDSWPEQARLAAEGRWDDLKTIQDGLRAGRKLE